MLNRYAAIPFAVICLANQMALAEEAKTLSSVVITATKTEQDSFDLPMSIDKVSKEQIQDGQLRMTLSESLARVPGITAQNRTQMAQDPQISSRGFGARSSFGVRGIRVYVDGIPLSMPDGIGNPGSVDLGMMDSIEVMRGPFSAMYGNSSGGVIQMLTSKSLSSAEISADLVNGSFNTRRESISASGGTKDFDYQIGITDFASDGYRQQSKSDKQQATVKLGSQISEDSKLTALINWFDQNAKDPGGLVYADSLSKPQTATSGALLANTRVARSNAQIGFNYEFKIDSTNSFSLMSYFGNRINEQYLSTSSSTSAGKVSSIDRNFYGTELKFVNQGQLLATPYTVSYGLAFGQMKDDRLDRAISAAGALTTNRDEVQNAQNLDQFAQAMWKISQDFDLHAGVRRSSLALKITDNPGGPNTGSPLESTYSKTTPVVGIVYKVNPILNFYANIGKGFETPTLSEVTYYDPTDSTLGPNRTLLASTSQNLEIGSKWMPTDKLYVGVAAFNVDTSNEIVISKLQSTTASYTNAPKTNRQGLEFSLNSELGNGFNANISYTYLDAKFQDTFTYNVYNTANPPVATPKTVRAGNRIPGTYRQQAFAELAWSYPEFGFQTAVNAIYNSDVEVDDLNTLNTKVPAATIFNVRSSFTQKSGNWRFSEYVTLNNITDVQYIGSVRVNDANSRYYEPAAPYNWIVGVKAAYKF